MPELLCSRCARLRCPLFRKCWAARGGCPARSETNRCAATAVRNACLFCADVHCLFSELIVQLARDVWRFPCGNHWRQMHSAICWPAYAIELRSHLLLHCRHHLLSSAELETVRILFEHAFGFDFLQTDSPQGNSVAVLSDRASSALVLRAV